MIRPYFSQYSEAEKQELRPIFENNFKEPGIQFIIWLEQDNRLWLLNVTRY